MNKNVSSWFTENPAVSTRNRITVSMHFFYSRYWYGWETWWQTRTFVHTLRLKTDHWSAGYKTVRAESGERNADSRELRVETGERSAEIGEWRVKSEEWRHKDEGHEKDYSIEKFKKICSWNCLKERRSDNTVYKYAQTRRLLELIVRGTNFKFAYEISFLVSCFLCSVSCMISNISGTRSVSAMFSVSLEQIFREQF